MNNDKNQLYIHTKSQKQYKILDIAYEEATMQKVIVYQAQYSTDDLGDKPIFTRPIDDFFAEVEIDGKMLPRFTPVEFKELQFITGNQNKVKEARQVFPNLTQLDIDLPEIQSLDPKEIIEAKLEEAKKLGYRNFFVEDISLFVESIQYPGPLVKWVNKAIGLNFGTYYENEPTRVVCSIGYCDKDGISHFVEGIVNGKLVKARGEDFGFNPIFQPEGYEETYAQMTLETKGKINHRAIALRELEKIL